MESTLPGTKDLNVYRGDTFEFPFIINTRVYDPDSGQWTKTPVDLTGATGKAQIRAGFEIDPPVIEFTVTIPDQSVLANRGFVLLSLTSSQTQTLTVKTGNDIWDFQLVMGGKTKTYLSGKVTYTADVTR